jgi:hypothetical protein
MLAIRTARTPDLFKSSRRLIRVGVTLAILVAAGLGLLGL